MTTRRLAILALVLALLFLAGHLPSLASSLEDIDSVNFALGVRHFDVAAHQPHPPGYPIFIAMGHVGEALAWLVPGTDAASRDARALAIWGAILGACSAFPLVVLFRAIEGDGRRAGLAAALTLANPLFWFNASRPMSDIPGLAVALLAQGCLAVAFRRLRAGHDAAAAESHATDAATLVSSGRPIVLGALLAGIAVGMRIQTAWLTLPLLAVVLVDRAGRGAAGALLGSVMTFGIGVAAWLVPLLVASGGPARYLEALGAQAGEDIAGVDMLATNPTVRALALSLHETFVLPWAAVPLGVVVLALAAAGAVAMLRHARTGLVLLAACTVPYLVFHLAFHETITTRYALPLVPVVAYLAVRGLSVVGPLASVAGTLAVAAASLALVAVPLSAYARQGSPLARALADRARAAATRPAVPRLGMHHAFSRALRGEAVAQDAFAAPPKREWLQLTDYWKAGGDRPVWFFADPRRTDLALIDPTARRLRGAYSWPFDPSAVLGGVRPSSVDWYEIAPPGWFATEGWALTPETAGVAKADGRGPARGGITAYVRRRADGARLLVGGRNLGDAGGPDVRFELTVDGCAIEQWTVPPAPGFFLRSWVLPAGSLAGDGPLAALAITARAADGTTRPVSAAVEQFDIQADGAVVFGYDRGWHEMEYSLAQGRAWRWTSDSADLRILGAATDVRLTVRGESPLRSFDAVPHLVARAGSRSLAELSPTSDFTWDVTVPLDALRAADGVVTLATDRVFVPDQRTGNGDRRKLGLRVFQVTLAPAPHR